MQSTDLILIAEDNPDDELLLRRALQKADVQAQVKVVPDGEEAILYLEQTSAANQKDGAVPSLIILDLKMPRKGGFEVLEWLTENPKCSVVPTIILTSSNMESDVQRAYGLGANTFFVKPNSLNELVATFKLIDDYWSRAERLKAGARAP
jgi:CheY-like chemotaxis protein